MKDDNFDDENKNNVSNFSDDNDIKKVDTINTNTIDIQRCATEILNLMDMIEWSGDGSYRRILNMVNPDAIKTKPLDIDL